MPDHAALEAEAQEHLAAFGSAAAEILSIANPTEMPGDPTQTDLWVYPLPLRWDLQLRYLWVGAADAFALVASTLPRRASWAVLGQVRFLIETYVILRWLALPEDHRMGRAHRLVLNEVKDLRRIFLKLAADERRDRIMKILDDMTQEVNRRVAAEA